MVQVNDWLALEVPSLAVTVTAYGLFVSAVPLRLPLMSPLLLLILSPGGRPVAL